METAETFGRLAARIKKAVAIRRCASMICGWPRKAIERSFRLLTENAKDFRDIPGLQITVVTVP